MILKKFRLEGYLCYLLKISFYLIWNVCSNPVSSIESKALVDMTELIMAMCKFPSLSCTIVIQYWELVKWMTFRKVEPFWNFATLTCNALVDDCSCVCCFFVCTVRLSFQKRNSNVDLETMVKSKWWDCWCHCPSLKLSIRQNTLAVYSDK